MTSTLNELSLAVTVCSVPSLLVIEIDAPALAFNVDGLNANPEMVSPPLVPLVPPPELFVLEVLELELLELFLLLLPHAATLNEAATTATGTITRRQDRIMRGL